MLYIFLFTLFPFCGQQKELYCAHDIEHTKSEKWKCLWYFLGCQSDLVFRKVMLWHVYFCNNSSVSACSSLCAVNHISFMMKLWRMCSILWGVVVWQLDKPPSWPLCVCSCMRTCLHLRWCAISLNKRCPLWSGQYRHTAYACLHGTITSVRLTTPL